MERKGKELIQTVVKVHRRGRRGGREKVKETAYDFWMFFS